MIVNYPLFTKHISIAFLKLLIAGILIGVFKQYDLILALLLFGKLTYNIYKQHFSSQKRNYIYILGLLLTGFVGIIGENWGISNGYWEYHEVTRKLPLWLPFAWMLSFDFLYRLEKKLIHILKNKNQLSKIILAILLAFIFPAFGEMITIKLGVWTYYWPYQIFGVPLFAFLCLVFIHMLIYYILHKICKYKNIEDVVFN